MSGRGASTGHTRPVLTAQLRAKVRAALGTVARDIVWRLDRAVHRYRDLVRRAQFRAQLLPDRKSRVRDLRRLATAADRILSAASTYAATAEVAPVVDAALDPGGRDADWLTIDEKGMLQPPASSSRFNIPIDEIWEARTRALAGYARLLLKALPPRTRGPQWRLLVQVLEAEVAAALSECGVRLSDTEGGPLDVCLRVAFEAAGVPHASRKEARRRCVAFARRLPPRRNPAR